MEVRTRDSVSQFCWHKPWAAISIADHVGHWPWVQENNRVGLLQIVIRDAHSEYDLLYGGFSNFCDKAKARQIMDFVYGVWDRIDLLLVDSHDGRSASAVTAALSYICKRDEERSADHFYPNLVYTMLLKTHFDREGWRT